MDSGPNHPQPLRIAFLHPDLGIGGAERLVIEAAVGLQERGHRVKLLTARYDPRHSLDLSSCAQLDLRVCRPIVPPSLGGRFRVFCAILRMMLLSGELRESGNDPHVVFCDLVPHVIPFLRRISLAKVVYYCHYPDLLLTTGKDPVYRMYRRPLDFLEKAGTARSHAVLVNSEFTRAVLLETFPGLDSDRVSVLYPGIDLAPYASDDVPQPGSAADRSPESLLLLSLNRFDPRKNLGLALGTLAQLQHLTSCEIFSRVRLIVAGGIDESLPEQRRLLHDLQEEARTLRLEDQVQFFPNISEVERIDLLRRCFCVIYTSPGEHFGLGIVEAMAAGKAVLAVHHGGPREIVRDGETGILRGPCPRAFAKALAELLGNPERTRELGLNGRLRAANLFSREAFITKLDAIIQGTVTRR